jgi:flagellar biosynthesis/type III secretory pathway chaperone
MNRAVAELTTALDRVTAAMDAEVDAVRAGQAGELSAAADRKRVVLGTVEPILRRSRDVTSAASAAERAVLIQATRRMQAATDRNAATLQGALEATRRLYACLAEAARAAASTGTYRPDGSRHRAEESVVTIHRSA